MKPHKHQCRGCGRTKKCGSEDCEHPRLPDTLLCPRCRRRMDKGGWFPVGTRVRRTKACLEKLRWSGLLSTAAGLGGTVVETPPKYDRPGFVSVSWDGFPNPGYGWQREGWPMKIELIEEEQ